MFIYLYLIEHPVLGVEDLFAYWSDEDKFVDPPYEKESGVIKTPEDQAGTSVADNIVPTSPLVPLPSTVTTVLAVPAQNRKSILPLPLTHGARIERHDAML